MTDFTRENAAIQTAIRHDLLRNGYTPLPNIDKACRLRGWNTVQPTHELIDQWARKQVCQATGIRVEKASELRGALTRALETEGPVLVDVVTAREELSMPPTITAAQIKGFTVWALKTVLSGRGDELLDLADTNVWRRLFH